MFTYEQINEIGDGLIKHYLGDKADDVTCVDIDGFVKDYLGLNIEYHSFAEEDSDKIGYISDGVSAIKINNGKRAINKVFPKGTIVVEKSLNTEAESGRRRFTISHEVAHFIFDKSVSKADFCKDVDNENDYTVDGLQSLFNIKETQVDRMGAAILMPRYMVLNLIDKYATIDGIPVYGSNVLTASDIKKCGIMFAG